MLRTLVIGDIHAAKKALVQVLERAELQADDQLIFLGDYVDAWSEAVETVDFLIELKAQYNCRFIRGNHDVLCYDFLTKGEAPVTWQLHGGEMTKRSYERASAETVKRHIQFYESLENYYIDAQNRLFLHAGYTNLKGVSQEYFEQMFYWDRTLWELATVFETSGNDQLPQRLKHYSEIFIGHTPLSKEVFTRPERRANVWNIDTGAAFKGGLTVFDIDSKRYWQSDAVSTLYPAENGRNNSPK